MPVLDWVGKDKIVNHDKDIPFRLLKKDQLASIGKDSQNLIIQGDNLEALKALTPFYYGKVKCIYIDPPYNTGHEDWAYNDNVNAPKIKEWIGQAVGPEGEDLSRHDKWLCMMYPRLKLLRELLSDEGVIFVSIDQNELHHLRILMDDIFDEKNFVEIFSWIKTSTPPGLSTKSRKTSEYILCYEKKRSNRKFTGELLEGGDQPLLNTGNKKRKLSFPKDKIIFKIPDGTYNAGRYERIDLVESIDINNGKANKDLVLEGEFKWVQETLDNEIRLGTTFVIKSNKFSVRFVRLDEGKYKAPTNLIKEKYLTPLISKEVGVGTNETASTELEILFGSKVFNYPKPTSLIKFLINLCANSTDIILDSFAGSGTTGHAVLDLNKKDGGHRKFILVELEGDVARKITAERVKRAIKEYGYNDGFEYCVLEKPLFDKDGQIDPSCTFEQLATYIYFTETKENIDPKKITGNLIALKNETEFYLLFKGKDKNVLNRSFLARIEKNGNRKIIYADKCLIDEDLLREYNIQFKQIPYEINVY